VESIITVSVPEAQMPQPTPSRKTNATNS
jgi:hypothetical protein